MAIVAFLKIRALTCQMLTHFYQQTEQKSCNKYLSLPSCRQRLSDDDCQEVERENNQNCSVLLCTTVVHNDMWTNVSNI